MALMLLMKVIMVYAIQMASVTWYTYTKYHED
jgi:hypothetical protein